MECYENLFNECETRETTQDLIGDLLHEEGATGLSDVLMASTQLHVRDRRAAKRVDMCEAGECEHSMPTICIL